MSKWSSSSDLDGCFNFVMENVGSQHIGFLSYLFVCLFMFSLIWLDICFLFTLFLYTIDICMLHRMWAVIFFSNSLLLNFKWTSYHANVRPARETLVRPSSAFPFLSFINWKQIFFSCRFYYGFCSSNSSQILHTFPPIGIYTLSAPN